MHSPFNDEEFTSRFLEACHKGGVYGAALFMKNEGVPFNVAYAILRLNGLLDVIPDVVMEVSFSVDCPSCGKEGHLKLDVDPYRKEQKFTGVRCPHCPTTFTFIYTRKE